jgi:hypothetical protein
LELGRKNINEEVQVLTVANAFNENFLPLVEKKCVDDDGGGSSGHDDSSIGDNNTYTEIYYFLNAFNNSYPNTKLKSKTTQEI